MPKLLILSRETDEYLKLIQQANLPNLEVVTELAKCEIILGEPRMLREKLSQLPNLKWIDRKSTRLNSSHIQKSRMPSSA